GNGGELSKLSNNPFKGEIDSSHLGRRRGKLRLEGDSLARMRLALARKSPPAFRTPPRWLAALLHGCVSFPRLLLSQAVQRPKTPHQIYCMNPDHWPVCYQLAQDSESKAIIRVVKGRYQHG